VNDDFLGNDLSELLEVLGEQALTSLWLCKAVECYGQIADELHNISDQQRLVNGRELLRIVVNLDSIVDGYFSAFRNNELKPWLVVRAIDSSIYKIEASDPLVDQVKQYIRAEITSTHETTISKRAEYTHTNTVTLEDSLPFIVNSLRRIQTEGEAIENFAIFLADEKKNYYIQVSPESDSSPYSHNVDEYSLYAEAVGNAELNPHNTLQQSQVEQMKAFGWKVSSLTPNFYQTWRVKTDDERHLIAAVIINTFSKIYRILPNQKIEVQLLIPSAS
jgi:hypothetical protein